MMLFYHNIDVTLLYCPTVLPHATEHATQRVGETKTSTPNEAEGANTFVDI